MIVIKHMHEAKKELIRSAQSNTYRVLFGTNGLLCKPRQSTVKTILNANRIPSVGGSR